MKHYLEHLARTIREGWDKKALCNWRGEEFTFGELAVEIEKFHIIFEAVGIKKGDRIALCAPNSARWAVSFLAINTYEAVAVPLLSDFTPEAIAKLVDHSESIGLFTDADTWKKLDKSKMPRVRIAVNTKDFTLLEADASVKEALDGLDAEFKAKFPGGLKPEDVHYPTDNWKDLAVINYTSGTTSAPKGVMLRYECFCAALDFSIVHMPTNFESNMVSMLPMGHIYGLVFEFIFPVTFGATIYYLGKAPAASTLLKAVADVKPYMIITVPLVMEKVYKSAVKPVISKWYMKALLAIPGINTLIYHAIGRKLVTAFGGNVTEFIMGGAALNPEVEKAFRKMKLPYTVGYGMTEASPLLAYEHPDKFLPGSCGKPISPVTIRIDSQDPEHIPGEIQAKGQNICSGYFNNPEASEGAFTDDGFLRTGDLGTMDREGNIIIRGRIKNMILSANGQNIYPEEVEAVVNAQDYVLESVVVDRASKLVALVVADYDAMNKLGMDDAAIAGRMEEMRKAANRQLPSYSQISKIELRKEPFEKTPKMSIKRFLYK